MGEYNYNEISSGGSREVEVKSASNGGTFRVTVTNASSLIVPTREKRKGLIIRNLSDDVTVFIELTIGAEVNDFPLLPGQATSYTNYGGSCSGLTAGGSAELVVQEIY